MTRRQSQAGETGQGRCHKYFGDELARRTVTQ
jgi:hypothetical protein